MAIIHIFGLRERYYGTLDTKNKFFVPGLYASSTNNNLNKATNFK